MSDKLSNTSTMALSPPVLNEIFESSQRAARLPVTRTGKSFEFAWTSAHYLWLLCDVIEPSRLPEKRWAKEVLS